MYYFVNKDDFHCKFWKKNYRVTITAQGIEFIVNADCEQDAIDYIIDYCYENNLNDLVASYNDLLEDGYNETEIDEFVCGGNWGLYLTTYNVSIEEI
jgi:hypothetical protein